ncbi:MAG: hypothetical protein ACJ71N_07990 [Terriglobales bacterium]
MQDLWARCCAIALTFISLLITGCSAVKSKPMADAPPSNSLTQFVYTIESNQVQAYAVTRDGSLMLVQSNAWSAHGFKDCMATSKPQAAIYVCNYDSLPTSGPVTSTVALLPVRSDGTLGPPSFVDQSTVNHFRQPVEDSNGERALFPFQQPCSPSTDPTGYPVICPVAARVFALSAASPPQLLAIYNAFEADFDGEYGGGQTTLIAAGTQADGSTTLWSTSTWMDHSGCNEELTRHWFAPASTSSKDSVAGATGFQGIPCPGYAMSSTYFTQLDSVDSYGTSRLDLYQQGAGAGVLLAQGPACSLACSVRFLPNNHILVVDQSSASVYVQNGSALQLLSTVTLPASRSNGSTINWSIGAMDQTGSAGVLVAGYRDLITFKVDSDSIALGAWLTTATPFSQIATRSQ